MTDILTTLPDAKTILVIAPNSDGRPSQRSRRPMSAGRKDQMWVVAHGADPSVRRHDPQRAAVGRSVAYFPERYGELVIPLAISLAKGETVPEQSLVTHDLHRPDNIDQYYPSDPMHGRRRTFDARGRRAAHPGAAAVADGGEPELEPVGSPGQR